MSHSLSDCWQGWCDGTALPNPGRQAIGGVLLAPDGTRHEISRKLDGFGCNNEAEAMAMLGVLELAWALGARSVLLHSDSDVIVRGVNAPEGEVAARLAPILCVLRTACARFESVQLQWIPGHRNDEADKLARQALGLPPRLPAKRVKKHRRR